MVRYKKDKVLAIIFAVISLFVNAVIIYQACLNGSLSSESSNGVTKVLMDMINFIAPNTINDGNYDNFVIFVRKGIGHFGGFMASGLFTTLTVYYTFKNVVWYKHLWGILLSLVFGLMLASITEIIQLTVDNRSGEFIDVLLDTFGYIFGILIVLLIIYLPNKLRPSPKQNQ